MPPKRKIGRPLGSKNKKTSANNLKNVKVKIVKKEFNPVDDKTASKCSDCNTYFPSKKLLQSHKALDVCGVLYKQALYSCQECRKKFRFEKSYQDHVVKEHSKLPGSVACNKCNVRCPDKKTLQEHIEKVHDRNLFSCEYCKKIFVRHAHVLRHLSQSGCDGHGGSIYSCEVCDATFTRKDNLTVHIRLQHLFTKGYVCKYCGFSTKNFSKLVNHWHKYHSDTPDQYQCHMCQKWISSRAALMKHLEIHGDKKYSCDVCGYCTFTVEVIRRHILTHVEEKPHKCHMCKKSYIQKAQLQRHLSRHIGNVCSTCGATFTSRATMLVHLRDHMGLEKLKCPFNTCAVSDKKFVNEASLNNHLIIHLEDKKHNCDVCYKSFHSEINLKRHLETHTLDKPRRCMYCVSARAYVRGEQLIRHVRRSHAAVFNDHLLHVRTVLGADISADRVKKSEIESVLNMLDAEADRILQGYSGSGVLYGGMQDEGISLPEPPSEEKKVNSTLMSENDLSENLNKLISQLIDEETLTLFGWPDASIDVVLEKVIEQCGAKPADKAKWTRVQRLRENTKHLFLYVIEDKNIARMLDTHTIDQIIIHILKQVSDEDTLDT